jgi:iodotyrosine deiodinase
VQLFLESAPYLIVIFAQSYGLLPDGRKVKNYYVQESVGIATGILITAIHYAGLVSLTHTPNPMGFLNQLLGRPVQERPFLILVVGYPDGDAMVPALTKNRWKRLPRSFSWRRGTAGDFGSVVAFSSTARLHFSE